MKQEIFIILLGIAGCLLIAKTVLFKRFFSNKSLLCWFFFGHIEVKLAGNEIRRREKQRQNALSLITLFTIILSITWFLLSEAG